MQPPITNSPDSQPPHRHGIPIWLPWVLAPGFLLLPISGCGLAATLRRSAFAAAAVDSAPQSPALVPVTTVATAVPLRR